MSKALLKKMGILGTYFSTTFALGCCGFGPFLYLVSGLSALGLGFLANLSLPILYTSLGMTVVGLLISYRHHRHPLPFILGLVGSGMILYPFHEALDVWIFRIFFSTGLALLTLGVIWDLINPRRWLHKGLRQGEGWTPSLLRR
ncbi:MAG TPA: MerC family mercury resistance protein [Candidatus Limnocylindrales bacterium]|nr:MerC family mercury resistance protein [Candidatus Limnocylindrales bacterium]